MDIDFENSPFSGFAGFTNKELEVIWNFLFTENSKLPDKLSVQKQIKTDNGIKVFISKNKNFNQIEFSFTGVNICKDNQLLSKIYCIKQLNMIVSILQNNDKYDLKIESDKSHVNSNKGQLKIIKIEINSKIDLEEKNLKDYITRERMFIFRKIKVITIF